MVKKTKIKRELYRLRDEWREDFHEEVKDLLRHPVILRMKLYPHHGNSSCYDHCVHVAYYNYMWCRFFKLDARSAARGGLMHDLFLYDWHTHTKETGNHFHGLTHPRVALKNANRVFELNKVEKDVIYTHMWPVTLFRFPKTKEGWITTVTDKYCGSCETSRRKLK